MWELIVTSPQRMAMFDQEKKGGWCFGEAVARDHESVDAESFHDDLCYMLNVTGGTHTHTHYTYNVSSTSRFWVVPRSRGKGRRPLLVAGPKCHAPEPGC